VSLFVFIDHVKTVVCYLLSYCLQSTQYCVDSNCVSIHAS